MSNGESKSTQQHARTARKAKDSTYRFRNKLMIARKLGRGWRHYTKADSRSLNQGRSVFREIRRTRSRNARIAAFGMTRPSRDQSRGRSC